MHLSRSVKSLFQASCHLTSASQVTWWTMLARQLTLAVGTSKGWTRWGWCLVNPKVLWFSKSGWLEVTVTCYCIPCPGLCFAVSQAVMPSPVSELRGPNIKHHEASFLEDYNFQQASPCIRTLRDPVLNRVTLVGLCLFMCYVQANQTMCSFLISSLL